MYFTLFANIKLKMKSILVVLALVSVINQLAVFAYIGCQQIVEKDDEYGSGSNRLASLFDWNTYMRFYDKQYSSLAQQLVRQKLFVARVLQVFLTQAKYRMYQLDYYTAINKWSDLTPNESKHMLEGDFSKFDGEDEFTDDISARKALLDILSSQYDNSSLIEEDLKNERHKLMYEEKIRRRRSTEDRNRQLSVANLVRGSNCNVKPDPNMRIKWVVSSDNPDYEPNMNPIELEDFKEEIEDIPQNEITELVKEPQLANTPSTAFSLLRKTFSGAMNWFATDKSPDDECIEAKEDQDRTIVIRDWRKSGCIGPARDQGYCASCYAVSSIGFLEWALCSSRDNVFTPLSVQYVVSCGKQHRDETQGAVKLEGCKHGVSKHTQDFIREYGVELEVNMPYVAREIQCPVEVNSSRKKKGYIRPNVKPPMRLSAATTQLDLALKAGPVVVSMREPVDFLAYGGGMVENCDPTGGHAMLIVGNMIEDGEEYLLIKNSFGPHWGYQGFFKFKRSSIKECVKEFMVPVISFPGRKSQARRIKAYIANQQNKNSIDKIESDGLAFSLDSLIAVHQK